MKSPVTICYVTDRHALGGKVARVLETIRHAIAAGVDWIQIREKDLPTRALLALVQQAVRAAQGSATKILVNDRLDVALAADAAGVHLGGESMPVAQVKKWCAGFFSSERQFLVGRSCHSLAEAQQAEREGADYIFFGPVFPTPSKSQFGPPQGTERLAEVCRSVRVSIVAIGGITADNAAECISAGAAGIAAIRLFQEAAELAAVVRKLRTVG